MRSARGTRRAEAEGMRLVEILLGASLLAGASGCPCPDGKVEEEANITRAEYGELIDRCVDNDLACKDLCRAVFEISEQASINKCVIDKLDKSSAFLEVSYQEPVECIGGRRPRGFRAPQPGSRAAADWLAGIATVEAASITAFARLVRALERFAAPADFIARAREAMRDEVVHAHLTARLARAMGARIEAPVIADAPEPTLAELAHENAVEGQVAETFGALVAICQAQLARDAGVRGVFARIAIDEARHAQLAHDLAPWLDARLLPSERGAIAAARRAAAVDIVDRFDVQLGADACALLGIPDARQLRAAAADAFARVRT
jgi:hypothetical protein